MHGSFKYSQGRLPCIDSTTFVGPRDARRRRQTRCRMAAPVSAVLSLLGPVPVSFRHSREPDPDSPDFPRQHCDRTGLGIASNCRHFVRQRAGVLAAGFGESKVRICAPNILFVAVASGIVSKYGPLGLSLATSLAGIVLIFLAATGLATAIPLIPRAIIAGLSSGVAVLGRQRPRLRSWRPAGGTLLMTFEPSRDHLSACDAILDHRGDCNRGADLAMPEGICTHSRWLDCYRRRRLTCEVPPPFCPDNRFLPTGRLCLYSIPVRPGPSGSTFSAACLARHSLSPCCLPSTASEPWISRRSLAGERFSARVELLVQGAANIASAFAGLLLSGSEIHTTTNVRGGGQLQRQECYRLFSCWCSSSWPCPVPSIPLPVISGILLASVCTMSHWGEIPARVSRRNAGAWLASSLLAVATDLLTAVAVGMFIGIFLGVQDRRNQPFSRRSAHW